MCRKPAPSKGGRPLQNSKEEQQKRGQTQAGSFRSLRLASQSCGHTGMDGVCGQGGWC